MMKKMFFRTESLNGLSTLANKMVVMLFAVTTISCSNDEGSPSSRIKEISQDIKDLTYFQGDEKAETVLILVPGGPSTEFATDFVDSFGSALTGKDILTVTVHQAQTLNPDIVAGGDITMAQANSFNTQSIEMLSEVLTYFKDEGRTVYMLGFSFGAFVTQDLIAEKGINSADKYLIISGRLDINDVIWQAAAEGKKGAFENGITPIIEEEPDSKERNFNRISADFGMNRYTQLFSTIEDLSNMTYIYGENDEAVGRLTTNEVQFLESKNTNVISGPGNHVSTFDVFIFQGLEEAFGIVLQ